MKTREIVINSLAAVAALSVATAFAVEGATSSGGKRPDTHISASASPHMPRPFSYAGYEARPLRNATITAAVDRQGRILLRDLRKTQTIHWGLLMATVHLLICFLVLKDLYPMGFNRAGVISVM
jgi:hypothetical protein